MNWPKISAFRRVRVALVQEFPTITPEEFVCWLYLEKIQKTGTQLFTSQDVEKITGYSGSFLRKLVREGQIKPERVGHLGVSKGSRYLYTLSDLSSLIERKFGCSMIRR